MTPKKLWYALAAVILLSFGVLGFFGLEIFRTMPPFPTKVVTTMARRSSKVKTLRTAKTYGSPSVVRP